MRWFFRSFPARAGAILVYCYGAVVAPTLHHAFHRPDHIHVGDSIVYLPEHDHTEEQGDAIHPHGGPEVEEHAHDPDADDEDHDHHASSTEPADDHAREHDEDHEHEESEAPHHRHAEDGIDPHHHEHHHHDDPDHGGSSVFHFGAALSDHIDRTPVVVASAAAAPLGRVERTEVHSVLSTRTLRVRGPPRRRAAET